MTTVLTCATKLTFCCFVIKWLLLFQSSMAAKQKLHDSIEQMALFSCHWKEYPALYDNKARDKLFKEDSKKAVEHLNKCYDKLAQAVQMTVTEVKTRWLKYKDVVTRAVRHYAWDLQDGTTNCPTPAAVKLLVFFWLIPFSSHYDPDLMDTKCLDLYVEKMLEAQLKRMTHDKEDVTELQDALLCVRKVLKDMGKPKHLELHVHKLSFMDLPALSLEHGVTFRANSYDAPVFTDERLDTSAIAALDIVDIDTLPYSISSWLSHTREPMFDWKVHGLEHHHFSVQNIDPVLLSPSVHRSPPSGVALKRIIACRACAQRSVDKARKAKTAYWNHFTMGVGVIRLSCLDECGDAAADCADVVVQGEIPHFSALLKHVSSAVEDVLAFDTACQNYLLTPSRRVVSQIDFNYLREIRKNSKVFSSSFWKLS